MTRISTPRDLPQVHALAERFAGLAPPPVLRRAARQVIDEARAALRRGEAVSVASLERSLGAQVLAVAPLRPVVNATGVLLHTNLGRAPLASPGGGSARAVDLEMDLATGRRGHRFASIEASVAALTGAESVLVVNNNAAALLLAVTALASGREAVVSRGQLVEIGGGFRVPEIVAQSHATLREIGTTNRTSERDYREALHADTGIILHIHPSNFEVVGYAESVGLPSIAAIGRHAGVPVVADLGSGLLDEACPWIPEPPRWLGDEPGAKQALAAGVDVVTFSGDKLLGGPQAGLICGRAELIEPMRRHPLARAIRFDRSRAAVLQPVLDAYLDGSAGVEVPFWALAEQRSDALEERATDLARAIRRDCDGTGTADVVATVDVIGAGSATTGRLPGYGVALRSTERGSGWLATALRSSTPPVVGLVRDGNVVLALRSVPPDADADLVEAVVAALRRGSGGEP